MTADKSTHQTRQQPDAAQAGGARRNPGHRFRSLPHRRILPPARQTAWEDRIAACRNIGFFYLANHGISPALRERTFAEAKRFFDQPLAAKMAVDIDRQVALSPRLLQALGGENLDPEKQTEAGDLKEGIKIGRDLAVRSCPGDAPGTPLHGAQPQWPAELPGWQGDHAVLLRGP